MKPHSSSLMYTASKLSRLIYTMLCNTTLGIITFFINLLRPSWLLHGYGERAARLAAGFNSMQNPH